MAYDLIDNISVYISQNPSLAHFPQASKQDIEETERLFGFRLPDTLREFYLRIGNGYSGASLDILGVREGNCSDFGNVLQTYSVLKEGLESEGRTWKNGLLPFCDWGCNMFSCVDCADSRHLLTTLEDFQLWPKKYSLEQFFVRWITGVDILLQEPTETEAIDVVNPFTNQKSKLYRKVDPKAEI